MRPDTDADAESEHGSPEEVSQRVDELCDERLLLGVTEVVQLSARGQTLITSTTADALPGEPAQLLQVTPGEVAWSA